MLHNGPYHPLRARRGGERAIVPVVMSRIKTQKRGTHHPQRRLVPDALYRWNIWKELRKKRIFTAFLLGLVEDGDDGELLVLGVHVHQMHLEGVRSAVECVLRGRVEVELLEVETLAVASCPKDPNSGRRLA